MYNRRVNPSVSIRDVFKMQWKNLMIINKNTYVRSFWAMCQHQSSLNGGGGHLLLRQPGGTQLTNKAAHKPPMSENTSCNLIHQKCDCFSQSPPQLQTTNHQLESRCEHLLSNLIMIIVKTK